MVLIGLGGGVAFNPLLLAAMRDVAPSDTGLASGVLNTASMMGGAFGLATLVSMSTARCQKLVASGEALPVALTAGYHVAFALGAASAALAAILAAAFLTNSPVREAARGSGIESPRSVVLRR